MWINCNGFIPITLLIVTLYFHKVHKTSLHNKIVDWLCSTVNVRVGCSCVPLAVYFSMVVGKHLKLTAFYLPLESSTYDINMIKVSSQHTEIQLNLSAGNSFNPVEVIRGSGSFHMRAVWLQQNLNAKFYDITYLKHWTTDRNVEIQCIHQLIIVCTLPWNADKCHQFSIFLFKNNLCFAF